MNISAQVMSGLTKAATLAGSSSGLGQGSTHNSLPNSEAGSVKDFASLLNERKGLFGDAFSNDQSLDGLDGAEMEVLTQPLEAEIPDLANSLEMPNGEISTPSLLNAINSANTSLTLDENLQKAAALTAAAQQPNASPIASEAISGRLMPSGSLQAVAAAQGSVAAPDAGKLNPASNDRTKSELPPTMFRRADSLQAGLAGQAAPVSSAPDNVINSNLIEPKNLKVLDLFASRNQSSSSGQANASATAQSNIVSNPAPNAGVMLSNPMVTQGSQVPMLPLATVSGLSSHLLMQVHPAITERTNAVENSLLSPTVERSGKTMELQLVPRSLGVVDMKIVNQAGQIRIVVETQTLEAQRLIQAEAKSMIETFKNAGLKLEEFSVTQNSRLEASNQNDRQSSTERLNSNGENPAGEYTSSNEQDSRNTDVFNLDISSINEEDSVSELAESALARDGLYL